MEFILSTKTYEAVHCNIKLETELNKLLTESSKISGRSKKAEILLRLEDHAKRYSYITKVGSVTEREK